MAYRIGQQLGNYTLVRLIGQGGFAEVYLGEHRYLKSQAALKVLKVTLEDKEESQFLAEAQTLVNLKHPNIIRVLDFAIEEGTPVLVMDYAAGGTLRERHPRGSRLSPSLTADYVKQIAAALQYAHNHNIIHRDVKPENILFDSEQRLLLSDFGLALAARPSVLLDTQELAGTLPYTAPEQLRGKPCFASDQYALGIVAYEWLCGKRPFEGNTWEIINKQQWEAPPPLREIQPDLPAEIEAVVLRALAKDHQQRFASVQTFALALERACQDAQSDMDDDTEITASLKAIARPQPTIALARASSDSSALPGIFLSATSADQAFVARLRADLIERGINVWDDRLQNTLHRSDPEDTVQDAIRAAPLVLIVLSPHARSSHTIMQHMQIANRYERHTVFIIAEGDDVADMLPVPEQWRKTAVIDVIDARKTHYHLALTKIHELLEDVTPVTFPLQLAVGGQESQAYNWYESSTTSKLDDIASLNTMTLPTPAPAQARPTTSPERSAPSPASISYTNRQRLLAKVRAFWITGVLEQSLHGAALVSLGLHEQRHVLANPWDLVFQQPETTARLLAYGTSITQVYDQAGGELLILGGPGSGKTTLLLELARDLLDRAAGDETHPMPVIFNLASWSVKRQPLSDWLVEELHSKYQVPYRLGRSWVEADQVLPLLDGLDEVARDHREGCLDAINAYHQEHGLVPLVVCSRNDDYLALATRALLRSAVIVQPLSPQQVDAYLARAGEELAAVRMALEQDATLRELVTTPLMLSVLTLAYQGKPVRELLAAGTPEMRRQQIFARYVQRMLERRGSHAPYQPQQTIQWLALLAGQLARHNQTQFYIEQMQPDWLPGRWTRRLYHALAIRPLDALAGISVGILTGTLHSTHVGALVYGLVGLLVILLAGKRKADWQPEQANRPWRKFIRVAPIFIGALIELIMGLSTEVIKGIRIDLNDVLLYLLIGALTGLVIGILMNIRKTYIQPVEIVTWSWRRFFKLKHVRNGILAGLVFGGINALIYPPSGLFVGLVSALTGWLLSALLGAVSRDIMESHRRVVPNQGIRRSARNGLQIGLIIGLAGGFIFGLYHTLIQMSLIEPVPLLASWVVFGVAYGLSIGLLAWLFGGGDAWIKHHILRLLLAANGSIPWNYTRFLDYAAECILLRKVGGGYIFTHRLLRDYFALLNSTSLRQIKK